MDAAGRPTVLVVDDEDSIVRLLTLELTSQGFDVDSCMVDETLHWLGKTGPDVVLMEVVLPGISGFEMIRKVKSARADVPVVFLTTQDRQGDFDYARELGADDYIVKPFNPGQLSNRINQLLKRPAGQGAMPRIASAGGVQFDFANERATKGELVVPLNTNDWTLLLRLATSLNQPVPGRTLLEEAWGERYREETAYLEVWMRRLRSKLEDAPNAPRVILGDVESGYTLAGHHIDD